MRRAIWQRLGGDEWSAFDALPAAIRSRISQHAYDAWSVNALVLWRRFRRQHASEARAERALLRYLDHCERLERRAFSSDWRARHGTPFPHDAARASVLRDRADPLRPPPGGDAVWRSQLPR